MADSKDRASKADVQSTPLNKMPVPELDTESATEMVYGTDDEQKAAQRSAFNDKQS